MVGVDAGVAWMGDCGILDPMMTRTDSPPPEPGVAQDALGRGVYDAAEAVRAVDFQHVSMIDLKSRHHVFRHLVAPSLKGLKFEADSIARWSPPRT